VSFQGFSKTDIPAQKVVIGSARKHQPNSETGDPQHDRTLHRAA